MFIPMATNPPKMLHEARSREFYVNNYSIIYIYDLLVLFLSILAEYVMF